METPNQLLITNTPKIDLVGYTHNKRGRAWPEFKLSTSSGKDSIFKNIYCQPYVQY